MREQDMKIENIEEPVYTVSQITGEVKYLLESTYPGIWIKGEVTNYKYHTSGHMYFSLKDEKAVIQAAMFKQYARLVKFEIEDGMEVKMHGSISVYPPRGQYQIKVDYIEPVGKGALQLAFEQLCERLQKEGIFDKVRQPIPAIPSNIGVVTSETGAALQDILRVTKERHAGLNIYIFPARVQGELAPKEIATAIRKANEFNMLDVLIVGRGGGSLEDLWAFNDPLVAYAIYESIIPVISAVGHEINYSISDMVADKYVSTPSAAATFVCKSLEEFSDRLKSYKDLVESRIKSKIDLYKEKINKYSPQELTNIFKDYLDNLTNKLTDYKIYLDNHIDRIMYNKKSRINSAKQQLSALNPLSILDRGYSIIKKNDAIISSVKDLNKGDYIKIRLKDGEISAQIIDD